MAATDIGMYGQPIAEGAGPGTLLYMGISGGTEIGGLLGVNTPAGPAPGGLQIVGGIGVVALTEFAPAGGVRGWQVELAPGFQVQPHLLATGFVLNTPPLLVGSCGIRFQGVGPFPPGYARIWLVDSTEAPIDPATVLGVGNGNFVSFLVTNAGVLQAPT